MGEESFWRNYRKEEEFTVSKQFLLLPQCFLSYPKTIARITTGKFYKHVGKAFNLKGSSICTSENGDKILALSKFDQLQMTNLMLLKTLTVFLIG